MARKLGIRTKSCQVSVLFGVGVLLAGLLLSAAGALWQSKSNSHRTHQRLAEATRDLVDRVQQRLTRYQYGLRGVRGAYLAAEGVLDRQRFRQYATSRTIEREFPGARGFGLIWRVAPLAEREFVAAAQRDQWPDFTVRQLHPNAGDRFVIQYIEPVDRNRQAVGLDIASEPSRFEAAIGAARSGEATLTAPITLVQATGLQQRSFLFLLPIYRDSSIPSTAQAREAATIGWSYAPLVMDEVLDGLAPQDGLINFSIRDLKSSESGVFYSSMKGTPAPDPLLVSLPMYGREWQFEVGATPHLVSQLGLLSPWLVGLIGSLTSLALAMATYAGSQARRRTRELREEEAHRAAIVHTIPDAVIVESLDGVIQDWNIGAERLLGFAAKDALGQVSSALLLPPTRDNEDTAIRFAIARGENVGPLDTTQRHCDGSLIDVSLTATPIQDATGRCIGYAKVLRDIRASRKVSQDLAQANALLKQAVIERSTLLTNANEQLADQQRYNNTMAETLERHAIVSITDRTGRITEVNDNFCAISGYSRDELLGRNHRMINSGYHDRAFWLEMWKTVTTGMPWRGEVCNRAKDGSLYWVDSIIAPFFGPDGAIEKYISIRHDISTRHRMAVELQRTNERMQLAGRSVGLGVWEYDIQRQVLAWDRRMYKLYGYNEAECEQPYALWSNSIHPDDRTRCESELKAAIDGTAAFDTTFRVVHPDGSIHHIKAAALVMRDAQGFATRMIGVNFDVTDRALLDAELSGTLTMLRSVLNAATESSIIATDCNGLITLFNVGAQRLLGYDENEMVGKLTPAVFHLPEEVKQRCAELSTEYNEPISGFQAFAHIPARDSAETRRWTYVTKNGEHVPVMLTVTAVRDSQNMVVGYLGMAHDIRHQEEQAQQLRRAVHEARRANHAKSVFLANMSHEIRTPMNAVIGVSYLLERTSLNADQADLVGKVKVAGKALLGIINNVLDLSKIEASELTVESVPFDLNALLKDTYVMASVQAQAKSIGFAIDASAELAPRLGDPTRLQQVLTNLVNNAIKFTECGRVTLSVCEQLDADGAPQLRFTVRDTGIGIEPEVLERLFQPFTQADTSTTRRFGGTGLGLSVVKQLTELMGGRVGVSSTVGAGSEFWVELALPRCDASDLVVSSDITPLVEAQSPASLLGVRVLVVDDSNINCEVARRILELHGAMVSLAGNGQEAVERLLDAPQGYDVVLMDVQMPVLDGLDATRRIRSGLGLRRLPIIALTAGALGVERQSAEMAGMDDFVSKPFEPEALVECIRHHVEVPAQAAAASRQEQVQPAIRPGMAHTVDWPAIEGIDIKAVQHRLNGDLALFTSLLQRLLSDFADLGAEAGQAADTLQAVKASAARLHLLKGTAGTLGAVAVQQVATQAEQLARAGHQEPLEVAMVALKEQLCELARHAEPTLARARALEDIRLTQAAPPLDALALQQLLQMLDTGNIDAGEKFHALAPALRHRLGAEAFDVLRTQIELLDYDEAAASLHAICAEDVHDMGTVD